MNSNARRVEELMTDCGDQSQYKAFFHFNRNLMNPGFTIMLAHMLGKKVLNTTISTIVKILQITVLYTISQSVVFPLLKWEVKGQMEARGMT